MLARRHVALSSGVLLLGAAGASSTVPGWPRWLAVVFTLLACASFGLRLHWMRIAGRTPPPLQVGRAWWADPALEAPTEDALGRGPFITRLTELLRAIDTAPDTAVLGLVGPWGSGKSTTLRWVKDHLDTEERWDVVDMGAWAAAGPDGVVLELLRALNEAWGDSRWRRLARSLSPAAHSLVRAGAPAASLLEPVSGVGPLLARLGWAALLPSATAPPIPAQLRALERRVGRRTRSTLVVVDDVDRLQPDELLALLKAVRVLGSLPRVHYLLVYDEETVLHQLRQTAVGHQDDDGVDRSNAFMEKIITLRLEQPPVNRDDAEALLRANLEDALTDAHVVLDDDASDRLEVEVVAFFSQLLVTPRAVRRFTAQLRTYLPLVRAEAVDPVDFAVLALIRIRYQRLYDELSRDRYVLTTSDRRADLPPRWRNGSLVQDVTNQDASVVSPAVKRLFPGTLGSAGAERAASRSRSAGPLRRPRGMPLPRVSDLDYVDRFFHLAPPVNDDDEPAILRAVEEWRAGHPGEAWARLVAVVAAAESSVRAARRSARLLRRAETVTGGLGSGPAQAVLRMVFALFPVPRGEEGHGDPAREARKWLGQAITRSGAPAAEVVDIASAGGEHDPFVAERLLALSDVLLDHHPRLPDVAALREHLVEAAWQCAAAAAARGDAGPPIVTGQLLDAVDQVAPDQLDALALRSLESPAPEATGLDVIDVAACWVTTRGEAATLPRGTAADLVKVIGVDAVTAAVEQEEAQRPVGPWSARRWEAHRVLRRVVRDGGVPDVPRGLEIVGEGLVHFPELERSSTHPPPDLRIAVSVLARSEVGDDHPAEDGGRWDSAFEGLVRSDPVSGWLSSATGSWGLSGRLWSPREERALLREAEARLENYLPDASPDWRSSPVRASAQLVRVPQGGSGPPTGPGGLRWTVEVGLWLRGLDQYRDFAPEPRPSVPRDQPVPAALRPDEVEGLTAAAVRWALGGAGAVRLLMSDDEADRSLRIDVRFSGDLTARQAVSWEGVRWRAGTGSSSTAVALQLRPSGIEVALDQSERIARFLVRQWRDEAGGDRQEV